MRYIVLIFICFSLNIFGQSNTKAGWLPKVNVSSKISSKIKWVHSIETKELIYDNDVTFQHNAIDVSSVFSVKTNLNNSLNLGYVVRLKQQKLIHKFIQQFNIIHSYNALKIGHRFGFEQYYTNNKKPNYKVRYRTALLRALNGDRIDIKEYYFKFNNELLWNFNKKDLEIRVTPYLGYQLTQKNKIELGIDYRLNKFINNNNTENNFLIRTTWYISL